MIKLTPAERYRRERENDQAQERRDRAWREEHAELVRRGLAEPLDDFPQRRRALALLAMLERLGSQPEATP